MTVEGVPTQVCPRCGATVPAGRFCGSCGIALETAMHERTDWLRTRVYAVAPGESVFLPVITSTLFPHLPQPARSPFRVTMLLMLFGLVCCAALGLIGPLVALSSLGVPLLFGLYLWQTDVHRDIPRHMLATTAVLGVVLGVGWVVLTGGLVARSYGIPISAGFAIERVLSVGLAISVGGAFLMVVPAIVIRLMRPPVRESLDGYIIGALGALAFTGAATTARLAPQFVAGLIVEARPVGLLLEGVLYGVAVPLTAAAAGGLIGIVLWFRPGQWAVVHRRRVRLVLIVFIAQLALVYTAIWLIDSTHLPQIPQLLLHIAAGVQALIVLRVGMQLALLYEEPDPHHEQPILCMHCERVVPDMPFCPACGASSRASSRTSRELRRATPPVLDDTSGEDAQANRSL